MKPSLKPTILIRARNSFTFEIVKLEKTVRWSVWAELFRATVKKSGTPSANKEKNVLVSHTQLAYILVSLGLDNYNFVGVDEPTKKWLEEAKSALTPSLKLNSKSSVFERARRHSKFKLRGYQMFGVQWLARRDCALLADDPGLGKSGMLLMASEVATEGVEEPPLLVMGSNIAGVTWVDEVETWKGRSLYVIKSKKDFRFPKPGEIFFCTWGKMPPYRQLKLSPEPGTILIGDEIHACKHSRTARSKAWNAIKTMVLAKDGKVWGATATALDKPGDFWNVLQACGNLGEKCFGHFNLYKKLYGGEDGLYGVEWPEGIVAPEVPALLKPWVLRREKREVRKDLPGVMPPRFIRVEISKRDPAWVGMKAITDYMDEHNLSIEEFMKIARTNQVDFLNLAKVRKACALAKVKALLDYVTEYEEIGENLIVMCCHRDPILALENRKGWAIIHGGVSAVERRRISKDFREGKLIGVACTIRAASESVTLTGASRMLFVDQDWAWGRNEQARGRNDRFGQTADYLFYDYLTIKDSVDEQVQKILNRKQLWVEGTFKTNG